MKMEESLSFLLEKEVAVTAHTNAVPKSEELRKKFFQVPCIRSPAVIFCKEQKIVATNCCDCRVLMA